MITCTKKYINFPFAHRQHNHQGHCHWIHGHNWAFEFVFGCEKVDRNGFVIDFGSLQWLKHFLEEMFDHTLVLNTDDPLLEEMRNMFGPDGLAGRERLAMIRVVPNCGAEGLATFLCAAVDNQLKLRTDNRVFLLKVTVFEDDKNSATFEAKTGGCNCA